MKKSILVDAVHSEETRVLVLLENTIEELDFESSTKAQHKGNIYLAKVSRVEPSLRAAFVDYGNNRHGFLPFSEIHPDYFQIPISDKEKLSVELYRYQLELNLKNDEFRHHSYVVNQFRGPHTMVPSFLINIHRVADKSDAQAYISRLDKVDDLFSQVIDQMNIIFHYSFEIRFLSYDHLHRR